MRPIVTLILVLAVSLALCGAALVIAWAGHPGWAALCFAGFLLGMGVTGRLWNRV